MAVPKRKKRFEKFDKLFRQLSDRNQENVLDYMEFLAQKSIKQAWGEISEIDEPLTDEEKKQLASAKDDDEVISLEDLKRELNI